MAIEKTYLTGGGVQLGTSHFDLQAPKPLDARARVPEYAGLQALIDGNAAYEGMIVYDEETKKTYQAQRVGGVLSFREFGISQDELRDLIASQTTAAMEFKGTITSLPSGLTESDKGNFYKAACNIDTKNLNVDCSKIESIHLTADNPTKTVTFDLPGGIYQTPVQGQVYLQVVPDDGDGEYHSGFYGTISASISSSPERDEGYNTASIPLVFDENGIANYDFSDSTMGFGPNGIAITFEDSTLSDSSYTSGATIVALSVTETTPVDLQTIQRGDSIIWDGHVWCVIPSGDDIEDTWRPVTDVNNDASLTFAAGAKLDATVDSNGTITYSHKAIEAPTDITNAEAGDLNTRTYLTAIETDGYGHITGYKTATENVEDTNTTYTFSGQAEESSATSVFFTVTSSEENATLTTVYLDTYSKYELDNRFIESTSIDSPEAGKIQLTVNGDPYDAIEIKGFADKLDKSVYDAYIADKEMSDEALKKYADDQITAYAATLGDMAKETAADYVTKLEATGYDDILTKTAAEGLYFTSSQVDAAIDAKIEALDLGNTYATVAQGAKADSAIQSVASVAGNGIKVTTDTTTKAVTIDWDQETTFVFNCGTSTGAAATTTD